MNLHLKNDHDLAVHDSVKRTRIGASEASHFGEMEDYVYLRMIEREWKRPLLDEDRHPPSWLDADVSPRASIVVLWSYFENVERRLASDSN